MQWGHELKILILECSNLFLSNDLLSRKVLDSTEQRETAGAYNIELLFLEHSTCVRLEYIDIIDMFLSNGLLTLSVMGGGISAPPSQKAIYLKIFGQKIFLKLPVNS